MKKSYWLVFVASIASIVISIGLAACSKEEEQSNLHRALKMLPADTAEVYFTDWALIKEYEDAQDVNSKSSSLEERFEFLKFGSSIDPPSPMRQATASAYGLTRIFQHAEDWTWDSTDLVWEVTVLTGGPPAYVLQFPDDFDFAPLKALFKERDFSPSEHQGATVYSHEMDLSAEWLRTSEFAILNTAVLEEEKRLVLSAGIENVKDILNVDLGDASSLVSNQSAQATMNRLGEVAAAFIGVGVDNCLGFGLDPLLETLGQGLSEEEVARLKERFEGRAKFHPYSALGVGYRYEEEQPIGLIVMHYTNADDAQADLQARRQLAEEGISARVRQPYSEAVFTVDQAFVEESDLVLRVNPVGGIPRRLFDMIYVRDMLFAGCQ